ncbi:baculoviral IAP repeat-containing protein 7 isoform X1 [Sapajus apella]|uniref:RING-type E3 ubiquitin transferase n=1 Tax=Sapajus apella TaxID=9515 RepID=A0A6J3G495_SAPAP|nr:baculoviral IAP repeat-containing protein 7 isoform X1 [Sapajus apella]
MHRACDHRGHPGLFQKAVGPGIFPAQGVWWQGRAYPCCPRVGVGVRSCRRAARHTLGLAVGPIAAADLARATIPSMGPEDCAKCLHRGTELSPEEHRGPRTLCCPVLGLDNCRAWDHVDGQILGQLRPLAEEEEEEGAGATSPRGPAFPGMGSEELRLASFYDWPLTAGVPPEQLAAAGFFHTGQQDKVRCFFCYGGLQSWKRGDDPWTEHARWFPRTGGKNQKTQSPWPPQPLPLGTQSCPRPEEKSSLKAPRSQQEPVQPRPGGRGGSWSPPGPGTWRSSCGGCRRRGPARCAWTAPCPSSLCPVATWSVPSAPPACSCAPSAGRPSEAASAPSCPRPGAMVAQVGCRVGLRPPLPVLHCVLGLLRTAELGPVQHQPTRLPDRSPGWRREPCWAWGRLSCPCLDAFEYQ